MTPAQLAFDIINRADNVQPCKYGPRGDEANAVCLFLGRAAGHEVFITEAQKNYLLKLGEGKSIITHGTGDARFAGFIKTIFSEKKGRDYFLLVFGGMVPAPAPPVSTPVNTDRANEFAAMLIKGAIERGRTSKDDRAEAGKDDYLCTWLSKAQADALAAQLPQENIKPGGSFLTVAAGSFAYWGKVRTASGAMLLCWMGEVGEVKPAAPIKPAPVEVIPAGGEVKPAAPIKPAPVEVIPAGCRIPLDMDIPF